MMHLCRKALISLSVLHFLMLVVVLAGFWMGYRSQQRAAMMKSHPFINNERCLEKMGSLPKPRRGFTFAVVGDIQREINKLTLVMDSLKTGPAVSFIIQTGDAVAHADPGHYRLFLNELATCSLDVPLFVVPGNHDAKNDDAHLFETYFGARQCWFEFGDALFIVADTSRGGWDDKKSDWLQKVLETRRACNRHAFLFMHQLSMERGRHEDSIENSDARLMRLIKNFNVNYVFSGHRHEYIREERQGTTFIRNGEDDDYDTHAIGSPFCYNLIRVGNDAIEERREVLHPYYVMLVGSELKDMCIAHLGDYLMQKPWTGAGMVLLLTTGIIVPLFLWYRPGYAAGLKNRCASPTIYHGLPGNLSKLSD